VTGCEQIKELYEAYVLGALDAQDREIVEAHLTTGCAACAAEIDRARWLVSQLAYLAPEREPPAALRTRLLEAAGGRALKEPRAWMPLWAWATAAALVLISLFSTYQARQYQGEVARLQTELERERQRQRSLEAERRTSEQALAILSASGTRELSLKPQTTAWPEIRAFWNPNRGVLIAGNQIPAPPGDRTFQLWVVPKTGDPISAGIFRPDAAGKVLAVSSVVMEMAGTSALAISEEPAGGLPRPTKDKIRWVGPLT